MTFSTPFFYLVFLPLALIGFEVLGYFGRRAAIFFLTAISLYFYAQWSAIYLALLLGSILVNYLFSLAIQRSAGRPRTQNGWLLAGIAANLATLGYYKYLFPMLNLLTDLHVSHRAWGHVILPLGISFFTFTQIAYLVDLKQGVARRETFLSYSLFVTFFPHLIAGPIIHHKEMMPQFREERRYQLNRSDMAVGLTWFTMGMFKKVMVADQISKVADAFYKSPKGADASTAWLGVLTYAMQLYFDFSGYSDMAVGLARMFSIRFPLNFNSPYKAQSILDFWQRWHMTLTRYIMDYVYSPVQMAVSRRRLEQGKKVSRKATATLDGFSSMVVWPTLFTLFLAGVWHGAGMQFLLYGLLHGCYLVINHAWRIFVPEQSRARKLMNVPVSIGVTFLAVLVGEVLFRAHDLPDAMHTYADLLGFNGLGHGWPVSQVVLIMGLLAVVWAMPNTQEILGETRPDDQLNWSFFAGVRWNTGLAWWIATTAAFFVSMFYSDANATFLYFQF
jgi:alginate O-acetyltransferase complex protein AlgI